MGRIDDLTGDPAYRRALEVKRSFLEDLARGDRPLIMDAPPSVHPVPTTARADWKDDLVIYTPEPGSPPVWWNPWAALEQTLAAPPAPSDSTAKRITIVAAACAAGAVALIIAARASARAR